MGIENKNNKTFFENSTKYFRLRDSVKKANCKEIKIELNYFGKSMIVYYYIGKRISFTKQSTQYCDLFSTLMVQSKHKIVTWSYMTYSMFRKSVWFTCPEKKNKQLQ